MKNQETDVLIDGTGLLIEGDSIIAHSLLERLAEYTSNKGMAIALVFQKVDLDSNNPIVEKAKELGISCVENSNIINLDVLRHDSGMIGLQEVVNEYAFSRRSVDMSNIVFAKNPRAEYGVHKAAKKGGRSKYPFVRNMNK